MQCGHVLGVCFCVVETLSSVSSQVTVTEVLLYAARQSGTVCLLAYVLLTLLRLFVDS